MLKEKSEPFDFSESRSFAKSQIWEIQKQYFRESGINAWRTGEVPQYITSNPAIAKAYADIVYSFFADQYRLSPSEEPIYILELGAGSGRFTYHFLTEFCSRLEQSAYRDMRFVYIMTDFVKENLLFWKTHPRFQSFFKSGTLDIAFFEAESKDYLYLENTNEVIRPGSLKQPIITIANYFFDSIPQELYYVHDQSIYTTTTRLINSVASEKTPALRNIEINYTYHECIKAPFKNPLYHLILEQYRKELINSHVLFPASGLSCISRLKALSDQGLLLLTADKGFHRIGEWDNQPPPALALHGSFSLPVNFHAFKKHCQHLKGHVLFPKHTHSHLSIGCLMYLKSPEKYCETKSAYSRFIEDYGPDDFFSIKKHIEAQVQSLSLRELNAYLKLGSYDSRLFYQFLPRYEELASQLTDPERYGFLKTAAIVWDKYFPLGETDDLAFDLALLLIRLNFHQEAFTFIQLSEQSYGITADSLYYRCYCLMSMNEFEGANALLQQLLAFDPQNKGAIDLLQVLKLSPVSVTE